MPRAPRIARAGMAMHITQRGNDRMTTFRCDDDHAHFGAFLGDASTQTGCAVHAYAFMSNHVHLLVTPADDAALSRMMHQLIGRYARHFNQRYYRTGSLWGGRFHSTVIDTDDYFFTCCRYIDRNPVEAGMVRSAADYAWSSYRCLALGVEDELVTPHPLFESLGTSDQARRDAYQALVATPLPARTLRLLRRATHRGDVLGNAEFLAGLESELGRSVTRCPHGGDRRSARFRASVRARVEQ